MKLELSLNPDRPVVQQPLSVTLRLRHEQGDLEFPVEPGEGELTAFELFDHHGQLLAQADGHNRDMRLGLGVEPRDPASILSGILTAGTWADWTENLTEYFELLTPGRYSVAARFCFAPSGIDIASERVDFDLQPLRCSGIDAWLDQAAMEVLHLAQQHRDADRSCTFLQFRSVTGPDGALSAANVDPAPASPVTISATDFATRESYEHDFRRWLLWRESEQLTLVLVRDDQLVLRVNHRLTSSQQRVVGRPVQHRDDSVSLLLLEPTTSQGSELSRLDFDAQGLFRAKSALGTITGGRESTIVCAPDRRGKVHLVSVSRGAEPWRRCRASSVPSDAATFEQRDIAPPFDAELLGLRLDVRSPRAPELLVAGLETRHDGATLRLGQLSLRKDKDDQPPGWQLQSMELDDDLLGPDEDIVKVDLLQAGASRLRTIAVTSLGRLFSTDGQSQLQILHECTGELADQALLVGLQKDVHLLWPDQARGVRRIVLGSRD